MRSKRKSQEKYPQRKSAMANAGARYASQMSADERIVSRANARKKKRRRKKLVFRAVLCGVFLTAAVVLVLFMFFNINTITVSGDKVYGDEEISAASGVKIGDNLIFVSGKKISDNLTVSLPYVGSVKIKRHLPASLEIIITETAAKYAVMNNGEYTLLDSMGKVLENGLLFAGEGLITADLGVITEAVPGQLIKLENEEIFKKLLSVEKAIASCGIQDITSVNLSNIYDIKLTYQGRITLILGNTSGDESLVRKLDLGKEVIKTQNEENELYIGTINLTVDGQAYWAEETVTEVTEPQTEDTADEGESSVSVGNSDTSQADKGESSPETVTSGITGAAA